MGTYYNLLPLLGPESELGIDGIRKRYGIDKKHLNAERIQSRGGPAWMKTLEHPTDCVERARDRLPEVLSEVQKTVEISALMESQAERYILGLLIADEISQMQGHAGGVAFAGQRREPSGMHMLLHGLQDAGFDLQMAYWKRVRSKDISGQYDGYKTIGVLKTTTLYYGLTANVLDSQGTGPPPKNGWCALMSDEHIAEAEKEIFAVKKTVSNYCEYVSDKEPRSHKHKPR